MCGIFGIFKINENYKINEKRFNDSLKFLNHRGPEIKKVRLINKNVILGHTRLSIIDLNRNNDQPQEIESRYSIVFNGEIYNYLELRRELKKKGITFKTEGDTEVLLKSYVYWGEKCVEYFNGMWAFAIYDKIKNLLFCSRDRFGVKPFCYNLSEQAFIFASEIKPLLNYDLTLKKPNYRSIANYCRFSTGAQNNETWFKNIQRLPPANNLIISRGKVILNRYWNYPKNTNHKISFKKAKEDYRKIFIDSVKIRMRSDVKIGVALSSGLDSSTIASCMALVANKYKYNTFTSANKKKK
jgi:asparagine synthase (glutamine-hydrolysing)